MSMSNGNQRCKPQPGGLLPPLGSLRWCPLPIPHPDTNPPFRPVLWSLGRGATPDAVSSCVGGVEIF
jgi:hypothetical protein